MDGRQAELRVASELAAQGFVIVERNWRRPSVEIDIIAKRKNTVYFIEVKYRRTASQGDGLSYVTDAKIRKLRLGADLWCLHNKWEGQRELLAAGVGAGQKDILLVPIRRDHPATY